ncbi:MAG: restriction endonuclease subunit S [Dialister micraerophilus]|uniref:restriction endonuclease subunit S n=1 Tax=Dialister micraerophilus TaxID=309120 RepID=UPI002549DF53|nr:restriction endonuclease subunit S [Dialister micraerophilus]MDK8253321.1 restriction endonuclease subunit S [Dialister micraerophilus]
MVSYPKDWRNRELSEVIHSYINGTSLERFFTKQVGKKVISLGNYSEDGKYIDDGIRVQENNKTSRYIVEKDDLCMVLNDKGNGRLVGRVILIDESNKYIFNQRSLRLVLDRDLVYPVFLHQYINSSQFRKNLKSCIQGNTQVYINPPSVMKLTINIPDYVEEQQAIADALTAFDTHINNLAKLIQKKKMIRDGAVEDLVSGKRRLAGFSGKWEECNIGNILEILHGKSQHNVESATGKYPILGSGGTIGRADKYLCDWKCVCIGRKGTIDRPIFVDVPFWSIDTLYYSKPFPGQNPKYQYYLFKTIDWLDYAESSGRPSLSKSEIESISIRVPSLPEQQAIADILTAMDKEIANLEKEKEKYMALKAGAMDDLLTGKIRLV